MFVGRVIAIKGHQNILVCDAGEIVAEVSGSLSNRKEPWELPKVGDWVVFTDYDKTGYIIEVLPRQNELSRKMPGKEIEKQVIATNLDFALIMQGLDRDFNLMRLQRYLHQVNNSNIKPIIILNKSDLVTKPAMYVDQVKQLGYNCPVILMSALKQEGMEEIREKYLEKGKTYALLGSSGVGKSTLMNELLGIEILATGSTSSSNNKGKHTTTSRNLMLLPNGSLLIDSPGMREFGLSPEAAGSTVKFHPRLDELLLQCRFSDCTHENEPGCAVLAAVESGSVPFIVYQSFMKLQKEETRHTLSVEEKRRKERQFGKMHKRIKESGKKRKY